MKLWIYMSIIFVSLFALITIDCIHTDKVFHYLSNETNAIYTLLQETDLPNDSIQSKIENLNTYWTEKMDILAISIYRKDLQPISDYLQYLASSVNNQNKEDSLTYARLLNYNVMGLKEITGLHVLNFV